MNLSNPIQNLEIHDAVWYEYQYGTRASMPFLKFLIRSSKFP
jgi:hypothetical protein